MQYTSVLNLTLTVTRYRKKNSKSSVRFRRQSRTVESGKSKNSAHNLTWEFTHPYEYTIKSIKKVTGCIGARGGERYRFKVYILWS